jgi:hypothetical protein
VTNRAALHQLFPGSSYLHGQKTPDAAGRPRCVAPGRTPHISTGAGVPQPCRQSWYGDGGLTPAPHHDHFWDKIPVTKDGFFGIRCHILYRDWVWLWFSVFIHCCRMRLLLFPTTPGRCASNRMVCQCSCLLNMPCRRRHSFRDSCTHCGLS